MQQKQRFLCFTSVLKEKTSKQEIKKALKTRCFAIKTFFYPILQELSYEDWETHFDEDFTDYIVSDICNYLHTGRYYDDEDTMYRAYFDFDYYEKHWTDYLKWVIDRHREECARDNNDQ